MRIDRAGNVSIGSGTTAGAAGSLRYLDIHNQDNGTATATGAIIRLVTRNSVDTSTSIVDIVKYRNGAFYINNSDTGNSSVSTNFGLNGTNIMSISSTGASVSIAPTDGSNLANKTYVDGLINTDRESIPVGGIFLVNLSNASGGAPVIGTAYTQVNFSKSSQVYTYVSSGGSGLPTGTYKCTSHTTVASGVNGTALFYRVS
jgi:hypothetical protein